LYVNIVRGQSRRFTLAVDSFQGQERDTIANTLTRRNPQGEIDFLSDIRRMNVGMTRARRKLLLVGDSFTLFRHPFFGELLAYVKRMGGAIAGRMRSHVTLKNATLITTDQAPDVLQVAHPRHVLWCRKGETALSFK
jgi:hypothetical protein